MFELPRFQLKRITSTVWKSSESNSNDDSCVDYVAYILRTEKKGSPRPVCIGWCVWLESEIEWSGSISIFRDELVVYYVFGWRYGAAPFLFG